MTNLNHYRVWCNTDSKYEFVWLDVDAAAPTTCPTDTGHTIDQDKTAIVETVTTQQVEFAEPQFIYPETIPDEAGHARAYAFSPDWTKRETWYYKSVYQQDENVGTGDGVQTVFNLDNDFVIDLTHGKVMEEELVPVVDAGVSDQPSSWSPVVKVNDVAKTERAPFAASGGDYTIDYAAGTITFEVAPPNGELVVCSYFYSPDAAGHSYVEYIPPDGKVWYVERAEAQFSKDIILNDSVLFGVYVDHPTYGLIQAAPPSYYKTVGGYLDYSTGSLPVVPAFGGASRGLTQDTILLQWKYLTAIALRSSLKLRIRVWLDNDVAFGGERATFTLYIRELDE